jgi:hypothetical protein
MNWSAQPKSFWWLLGSAALMVVGGFGPWATAFGALGVNGTNGDGWFLIIGGIAAAVLAVRYAMPEGSGTWPMIVAALIGAGCTVVAIVDLADISSLTDNSEILGDIVDPGWGLWMSAVAAGSLTLASIATLVRRP